VVHPGEPTRLADDEYTWVMHCAKRGGPADPEEISRYRDLCARLNDTISGPGTSEDNSSAQRSCTERGAAIGLKAQPKANASRRSTSQILGDFPALRERTGVTSETGSAVLCRLDSSAW
jgi:hypothetical protein